MRIVDADEIIKKQRDLARRTCDEVYANDWHNPVILGMASMYGIVADAPTIDPVKHGKWLHNSDRPDRLICSVCDVDFDMWYYETKDLLYCPVCGAKMDGGKE